MTETTARVSTRPRRRRGLVLIVAAALAGSLMSPRTADAAPLTSGGWTTNAVATPASVPGGATAAITVTVSSAVAHRTLVDVEIFGPGGRHHQQYWDNQRFRAGQTRTYPVQWAVPANATPGTYTVKIGVFGAGWVSLHHWNDEAASVTVTSGSTTTTTAVATTTSTTAPPTPTTTAPTTTAPPTTTTTTTTTMVPPPSTRFAMLPPGASLPGDAQCAALVRPGAENRSDNQIANQTRGVPSTTPGRYTRVTGNFVGTTDEIIQWAACKWGIDEDYVRAQVVIESWWHQSAKGDWTTDGSRCAPGHGLGADGVAGQCPESFGLLQLRYPYWGASFPWAITSSAFNLDYALAARRSCYEGDETWLNTVERGRQYVAGDIWGCMGAWFSGRWYTDPAVEYIGRVQASLAERTWEQPYFQNG